MGSLPWKPERVAPRTWLETFSPVKCSQRMAPKSLAVPEDGMKRSGLRSCTFAGPVKDFPSCKLRDGVQLSKGITESPVWVISEDRWLPLDLSAVDRAGWRPEDRLGDLPKFPPAHASCTSMIKPLEGPKLVYPRFSHSGD